MLFEIYTFVLVCNKADKFLLLWFYKTFKGTVYNFRQRVKQQYRIFFESAMKITVLFSLDWSRVMYEGVNSLFP
jgi:hypothetical protein